MRYFYIYIVSFFLLIPYSLFAESDDHLSARVLSALEILRLEGRDPSFDFSHRDSYSHLGQMIHHFDVRHDNLPVFYSRCSVQMSREGFLLRLLNQVPDFASAYGSHPQPVESVVARWMSEKGFRDFEVGDAGWIVTADQVLLPVVRVFTEGTLPEDYNILYLDAHSGLIVETDFLMQTGNSLLSNDNTLGMVFEENPVTTPDVKVEQLEYLDENTDHLYGRYVHAETCIEKDTCKTSSPIANRRDASPEGFLYSPAHLDHPDAPDPFAEVNAYRNVTHISSWIHEQFGWDGLFAEETWLMVRVGRSWNNAAYYSGTKSRAPYIVFGVDDINYAYDADTAYHEFGHAINDLFWQHSWMATDEFGIDGTMYAIEEALADTWSATLSNDPVLNAYVTASRNVDNGAKCPESLYGEGHYDSRVVSAFLWDLRQVMGADSFNHILYRSLSFLDNPISFSGFVSALEHSAYDLFLEDIRGVESWHIDLIQEYARERGLLDQNCNQRLVPFGLNQTRYVIGFGRDRTRKMNYPFGIQWELTATDTVQNFKIQLSWVFPVKDDSGEEITPGYRVHIRKNRPVEVIWRDHDTLSEGDDAFDVKADYTWNDSPDSVTYPAVGEVSLEHGDKVYLLISSNTKESVVAIKGTFTTTSSSSRVLPSNTDDEDDYSGEGVYTAADGASCQVSAASFGHNSLISLLVVFFFSVFQN